MQAAKELGVYWWTVDLYLASRPFLSVDNNDSNGCLGQMSTPT